MSSGTNNKATIAFLPSEFDLPTDDPQLLTEIMNERERNTGTVVNQKTNGVFTREENVNSETWFFEANAPKNGFRKMFLIPALVAGSATTITHGLGNVSTFTFTDYRSWVQDTNGTSFRPLPADFIQVTSTSIIITVPIASPYNGMTGQIVLEYVKS